MIIIQTYNHAPFIAQAVDSVLVQETDFNYEIVLGEDERQDGTREICIIAGTVTGKRSTNGHSNRPFNGRCVSQRTKGA